MMLRGVIVAGFSALLLGGAWAENITINTKRGLTTPFTLIYPASMRELPGARVAGIEIPNELQCELAVSPHAGPQPTAQQQFDNFNPAKPQADMRKIYADYTIKTKGRLKFQSGDAMYYTADFTAVHPKEAFRAFVAESFDGGRRYELTCSLPARVEQKHMRLMQFIFENFSTKADAKCCVDLSRNPSGG